MRHLLVPNDCELILASSSPRRIGYFQDLGLMPLIISPDFQEEGFRGKFSRQVLLGNALGKALSVAKSLPVQMKEPLKRALIISADTVVVHRGRVYGKPKDRKEAEKMIRKMTGSKHYVYTAVAIVLKTRGGKMKIKKFISKSEVEFGKLPEKILRHHIETGDYMDKAGAYAIQGCAGVRIKTIKGSYSNVVGLPLYETLAEMEKICR